MKAKCWLSAATSGLALALWAMPAAAAPISGATTSLKVAADGNSIVETTHWRRRHAYYYGGYSPYYYYRQPSYRYSYAYPSYNYYYAYPRHRYYYGHHHHHYRQYRGW